jgi:vacuolar-type H+-ATPase subunit E/Vma4
MVNIGMAQRLTPERPLLARVLARARDLAEEVRLTAERVHQQAQEAHRLTATARQQAERGRELSKVGREEARAVINAVKWSLDTAGNGKSRTSVGDET